MTVRLNPEQRDALSNMISEVHESLTRMEGEKQFQKDVAQRAKDELGLSTSDFNAIAKNSYSGKLAKDYQTLMDRLELAETVGQFSFEEADAYRERTGSIETDK